MRIRSSTYIGNYTNIIPMVCLKKFLPNVIIEPPRFIFDENVIIKQLKHLKSVGFREIMVNNIAYLKIGSDLGFELNADFSLNITNISSVEFLKTYNVKNMTASLELNFPQISELQKHIKTGIIAYGHLPLMLTRNCPVGNCQKCDHKLQDRTGRVFEVACYRKYFEILNCVPLYIADILPKSIDFVTLYFNSEKKEEILKVINTCEKHLPPLNNFTRGLYNK